MLAKQGWQLLIYYHILVLGVLKARYSDEALFLIWLLVVIFYLFGEALLGCELLQ